MNLKPITIKMSAEREAEVYIYEEIGQDIWTGSGITAKGFTEALDALGDIDKITVRVNSPGGSVYEANAIYNALVRHPARKVVEIDGIAASAAGYISMAGDEIRIAENGMFMAHRGHTICIGDCNELLKTADILEKYDNAIANIYAKRTGRRQETWLRMMNDETWFNAEEAVENRLADSITPNKERRGVVASYGQEVWNRGASKHPEKIAALLKLDEPAEKFKVNLGKPEMKTVDRVAFLTVEGSTSGDISLSHSVRMDDEQDITAKLAEYKARAEAIENG